MMSKFPFTNDGAADLFAALYQLPDEVLQEEIILVQQNFKEWVANHFILSTDQESYLNNLPATFTQSAGALTALAMSNRLPVMLNKPDESAPTLRKGKLVDTKNSITTQYEDGTATASGEVVFNITY